MHKTRLPPLGTLRAFHLVAEWQSFKLAAEQLNVSATAVSHQIRQLESTLDCRVFERSARGVSLTDTGRVLYEASRQAFGVLEHAMAKIDHDRQPPALTITTTSNFLTNWLIPRMADFKQLFPDIDLRLHTSVERVDLTQRTVNIAIRYREAQEPGLHNTELFVDRFQVFASPTLNLQRPEDLLSVALFHVENRLVPAHSPSWENWKKRYGPSDLDTDKGLRFSDETHALQAAVAGQGVVIASELLAGDLVRRGVLEVPFAAPLAGGCYLFLTLEDVAQRADVRQLREWIVQQMAQDKK
ncbi:LysR family transcriptional regulator [Izhakiella australiensis]|uniref:LysR family transcriptional regulator n=1 Tax=Izhakiella australiensis TaxID=1926881 RepID=A0A1S8YSF5_9GAMM|nr:LysR substrate-binding domain-containing protein [Izhakiella australiensis]OON42111.1 LysR family transcriptional regulator [Izhakiella australiensis]